MSLLSGLRGSFRRRADDVNDFDDDNAAGEGIPQGVPSPPAPRIADVEAVLNDEVARSAQIGLPPVGYPNRPLPREEEAVKHHNIDQNWLSVWAWEAKSKIAALLEEASDKLAYLASKKATLQAEQLTATSALDDAKAEIDEPDRRFTRQAGPWTFAVLLILLLGLGSLEVNALQPILGQVLRQSDLQAWGLAIFMVSIIAFECHITGVVLRRWLAYEGPRRIRVAQLVGALFGLLLAIAALAAVVIIRMVGAKTGAPGTTSLLYVATQGGVEFGALALGWWHGNPRVRQIHGLQHELATIEDKLADNEDQTAEVAEWQHSLRDFSPREYLSARRPQLADDYAAVILAHRHNLWIELVERGHHDSADTLLMLPLPAFVLPTDIDDDADWITGGFLLAI